MDHHHHTTVTSHDYVIIGGGIAGLSAAIHLAERGATPLLIEACDYPSHKVCGEFFSPEALPLLAKWDLLPSQTITHARFRYGKRDLSFDLPQPAGSQSHYTFDAAMAAKAVACGVDLRTNTRVESLTPLTLSTGETIQARNLLIGTGRLVSTITEFPYIGLKAHFADIDLGNSLEMRLLPGAYMGLATVEPGIVNVACLATKKYADAIPHPGGRMLFDEWMRVPVPHFGVRTTPNWPNTYFIGDAAGSIPPASGDGLAMALTGGKLAAHFALKNDAPGYKKAWHKTYAPRIRWATLLHHALLNARLTMPITKLIPSLPKHLFALTRG